ncbi:MAG: hypothetical protein Q8Q42_03260 [Nanoarchaeota archaeon]|nr:hypothetical protein [Nanoarchaeota archaeon]
MGLFGKKKKEIVRLPELPRFEDDLGLDLERELSDRKPELPSYDSPFSKDNADATVIGKYPEKDFNAPIDETYFEKPKKTYEERIPSSNPNKLVLGNPEINHDSPFRKDVPFKTDEIIPSFKSVDSVKNQPKPDRRPFEIPRKLMDKRPVFVQIDNYREAMNDIELMKQKVREVEYILDRLNEIKSQESLEISNCETSLEKIKEKLVEIDKRLFEI